MSRASNLAGFVTSITPVNNLSVGVVTATSFIGDGSGLTGIVGSGSGIIILDGNVTVGTAGTINFGENLSVSPISAGLVTVTGSSYVNTAGVSTYASTAGISTYTSEWILGANGSTDYTFTGPGFTTATNDPTLFLIRGQQYRFTNTMGIHPFRIQSTPNGSVGTQYNTGITNNDVTNGTLTWNVDFSAPDILYYQCTSHASMGGKIYILNAGISSDTSINTTGIITATTFDAFSGRLKNVELENYSERVYNLGNTGASTTINLVNGNFVTATLTDDCTFTFNTGISTGAVSFTLFLTNDATPNRSITWPVSVKWPNNIIPTRTTAASKSDVYTFFTYDNGTSWYGNLTLFNYPT